MLPYNRDSEVICFLSVKMPKAHSVYATIHNTLHIEIQLLSLFHIRQAWLYPRKLPGCGSNFLASTTSVPVTTLTFVRF